MHEAPQRAGREIIFNLSGGSAMEKYGITREELLNMYTDADFVNIFLPLYKKYKTLDRDFDKKVIDKDLENLKKKFETIATAKERRKTKS
jgi:hypothetical protein